jgi:hypothetical protein
MIEIRVAPSKGKPDGEFDILVVCLGYETRSLYIAERYTAASTVRLALAFKERLVGNYDHNRRFYEAHGFKILPFNIDQFAEAFHAEMLAVASKAKLQTRVLVDISSMSRPMIATVVVGLSGLSARFGFEVTFVYCPAVFTKPSSVRQPVTVSQPVIPELAGWSVQPERSVAAIVGLGFEFDQALGAIEFLEPAVAWTFIPFGEDQRFDRAVAEANKDLLTALKPERIVRYNVADPYQCFVELEALTYGLMDNMRPIIVPFGPKLFALLSFLIGVIHSPNVSVWRVSGDQVGTPDDRVASGNIISLNTIFSSND